MDLVSLSESDEPEVLDGVFLAQLAAGERTSVQHFRLEPGADVDEHSHEHEQAGYLFEGDLRFVVDGTEYRVTAGDAYVIPGHTPHAVTNDGDEPGVGVEIFSPPRSDPPWAGE